MPGLLGHHARVLLQAAAKQTGRHSRNAADDRERTGLAASSERIQTLEAQMPVVRLISPHDHSHPLSPPSLLPREGGGEERQR